MKKKETLEQQLKKQYYKAYYKFEKKLINLILKRNCYEWWTNLQEVIDRYNKLDYYAKNALDNSLACYLDNDKSSQLCGTSVVIYNTDQYTINLYNFINTFDVEQDYIVSVQIDVEHANVGRGKYAEEFDYVKHIKLVTKTSDASIQNKLDSIKW